MKTILIYASKHGCTKGLAKQIAKELNVKDIVNINNESPNIDNFDQVILGTPVYAGMLNKKLKKLCKENIEVLSEKKIALFISRADAEASIDEIINQNIPELAKHISIIGDLGGEFRNDKLSFFEKKIVAMVSKGKKESVVCKNEDNINKFIEEISKGA